MTRAFPAWVVAFALAGALTGCTEDKAPLADELERYTDRGDACKQVVVAITYADGSLRSMGQEQFQEFDDAVRSNIATVAGTVALEIRDFPTERTRRQAQRLAKKARATAALGSSGARRVRLLREYRIEAERMVLECARLMPELRGADSETVVGSGSRRTGGSPSSGAAPTVTVRKAPLSQDPDAAIAYDGNDVIFEARVTESPGDHVVVPAGAEPGGTLQVYLPVPMEVTAAYKGEVEVGDQLFVRDLGGRAPDGTTMIVSRSVHDLLWEPGRTFFVFGTGPDQPAGDPHRAVTWNMIYIVADGIVRPVVSGESPMPLADMRRKLESRR